MSLFSASNPFYYHYPVQGRWKLMRKGAHLHTQYLSLKQGKGRFCAIKCWPQLQLSKSDYKRLLHKPYVNEVYLTGQNPPLKCCQHLEIQYTVRKRVDLLMLKILGL